MRHVIAAVTCLAAFNLAAAAQAHPHPAPHAHGIEGLTQGFLHPLFGIDHLLAMLAVGLLAAQFAGREKWYAPGCFVSGVILGGCLGIAGLTIGYVEVGIALSLIVLGCALAVGKRLQPIAVLVAAVAFGLVHGIGHGGEVPGFASPILYVLGFTLTTILLHLAGVGIGSLARQSTIGTVSLRVSGIVVTALGMFLLAMM